MFAIFVADTIVGGSLASAGIAVSLYLLFKSIFEIPVGIYIDRSKSEKDDLYTAFIGTILSALIFFAYPFANSVLHVYILQIFFGIASALAFPGWYTLFTHHVDKGKAGFEWSLYDVLMGLGMAATAALGGFLAESFGFNILFICVGVFTLMGAFLLLVIKNRIYT